MKECTSCVEVKPLSEFYSDKSRPDGLEYRCKKCSNEHSKRSYLKNREKSIERARKWREDNKEYIRNYTKEYRKNNKEKIRKKNKEYYLKNAGRLRLWHKEYELKNKEKIRHRRRIRNLLYGIASQRSKGILNGDGICLFCGNIDFFVFETHHVFGRENSDFAIEVCSNCHHLLKFPLFCELDRRMEEWLCG